MTWWAWTLLWVVLVAFALTVFFRLTQSLWRKVVALVTELAEASERLSVVTAELEALVQDQERPEPAVFADPAELRRERYLSQRDSRRGRGPASARGRDLGEDRRT